MIEILLSSDTLSRSELEAGFSLIRAFYPDTRLQVDEAGYRSEPESRANETASARDLNKLNTPFPGIRIHVDIKYPELPWLLNGQYSSAQASGCQQDTITLGQSDLEILLQYPQAGKESARKYLLKLALFRLLSAVTGRRLPWGILTGIRPGKIPQHLEDCGIPPATVRESLRGRYLISEDKVDLLQNIAAVQRPFLKQFADKPQQVAVYLGIPFCPTRCSYCSFPAYSLQQGREPLMRYLEGLLAEIRRSGAWMAENGLMADSLYIGGGTPSILTEDELTGLLQQIKCHIPLAPQELGTRFELTLEAGRPDTLSREKLQVLAKLGITRISINPQSMHNRTLQRIGRSHTVEEVVEIYREARAVSDWLINMDLILGLPGENAMDVEQTLRQIALLKPDNLTVHALAIKRGSKEHEAGLTPDLSSELETMQDNVLRSSRALGMHPYYLYRQKQIAGNLENIGLARPGTECRYNIGIMEERQSVIGLGAGASSKIVNPRDHSLINLLHPSNWQIYCERWQDIQARRASEFNKIKQEMLPQ